MLLTYLIGTLGVTSKGYDTLASLIERSSACKLRDNVTREVSPRACGDKRQVRYRVSNTPISHPVSDVGHAKEYAHH